MTDLINVNHTCINPATEENQSTQDISKPLLLRKYYNYSKELLQNVKFVLNA